MVMFKTSFFTSASAAFSVFNADAILIGVFVLLMHPLKPKWEKYRFLKSILEWNIARQINIFFCYKYVRLLRTKNSVTLWDFSYILDPNTLNLKPMNANILKVIEGHKRSLLCLFVFLLNLFRLKSDHIKTLYEW